MRTLPLVASVALGGAIGSVARFLLNSYITSRPGVVFPLGTLVVNVIGCFVIGALMYLFMNTGSFSPAVQLFLTTGLCGGFTTFSTFAWETVSAMQDGEFGRAMWYVGLSLVLGLLAAWAGCAAAALGLRLAK